MRALIALFSFDDAKRQAVTYLKEVSKEDAT